MSEMKPIAESGLAIPSIDCGCVLRAAIREHVLDRFRERSGDAPNHSAEMLEWPTRESLDPSSGLGGRVAHPSESREGGARTTADRVTRMTPP